MIGGIVTVYEVGRNVAVTPGVLCREITIYLLFQIFVKPFYYGCLHVFVLASVKLYAVTT